MLARLDRVCKTYSWHTHTHTHPARALWVTAPCSPLYSFLLLFLSFSLSDSITPSVSHRHPPLPTSPLPSPLPFQRLEWHFTSMSLCVEVFLRSVSLILAMVARGTKVSRPECWFLYLPSQVIINVITADRRRICARVVTYFQLLLYFVLFL